MIRVLPFLLLALLLAGPAEAAFRIIVTELEAPLVPNSIIELADRLGHYRRAGVEVALVRVQQTPSAVAALRSGQGEMANIGFDTALQLVARNQMKLKGVVSPDRALPFILAAKRDIADPKQLEGRSFAVSRIGAVDHSLTRLVLTKLGVAPDRLSFVAIGQPAVRATALASGRVDATTVSIGVWASLPERGSLSLLVEQKRFHEAAPLLSKLNVVTEEVMQRRGPELQAVVRALILAARDMARHPGLWVEAMEKARPDVPRATLAALADSYAESWCVNGGIDRSAVEFTTQQLFAGPDFQGLRTVAPAEWIDTRFVDDVLRQDGSFAELDPAGR